MAGLLALAAGVRLLRFGGEIPWPHSDESNVAVPALQILTGTFPVHHVGVEYVGATAAYPMAVWFRLFGPSTTALDLFCYAVGLAVVWTGYLVARRLLPPSGALGALAVLAVPPLLLAHWAVNGALNPPVMLVIGNLLLLCTHAVFAGRPVPAGTLLVIGLLAGIGWWAYPLIIVYGAPFAVLAFRTGLVWRARFWLLPLGLLLGGLPDWIYELLNFPTARVMLQGSGSLPPEPVAVRASMLAGDLLPQLVGAASTDGFAFPVAARLFIGALAVLALLRAIVRGGPELRWIAGGPRPPALGPGILWPLAALLLLLILATKRTLGPTYLLPLYSVLPIWIGDTLGWLWSRRRRLAAVVLALWLALHLWANWAVTLGRPETTPPRWSALEAAVRPLDAWLTARGIGHVYWAADAGLAPFEVTFLTGGRVIAADMWAETIVQHAHAVDAQDLPPIVTTANRLPELRASLGALALALTETAVGRFVVVEARPTRPMAVAAIPPTGWTVTASHRGEEARNLIDRDAGTAWSVGNLQRPGQWLAVDLGREETVSRIDLLSIDWQEVPIGFRVERSRDGVHWDTAVDVPRYWGPLSWSERHPFLKIRRGRVQVVLEPAPTRHLRIVLTGESTYQAWAARELFVYAPASAPAPEVRPGEVAATLAREGIAFVYANPWLSARARVESRETIGTLESNSAVNSYGRSTPPPMALERFRFRSDRAILLGADADGLDVRRTLAARGALARERAVGSYALLVLGREASRHPIASTGWRARASAGDGAARRAVDGKAGTSWTAGGPVTTDTSVTLELDRPRALTGLHLTPGSRDGGPADFVLDGSADGQAWTPLGPATWVGPLYWTGAELLRNSRTEWAVTFPAATVRYVRIRPAAPAPAWSIAEITAFE
jgi:hypothetical protein